MFQIAAGDFVESARCINASRRRRFTAWQPAGYWYNI